MVDKDARNVALDAIPSTFNTDAMSAPIYAEMILFCVRALFFWLRSSAAEEYGARRYLAIRGRDDLVHVDEPPPSAAEYVTFGWRNDAQLARTVRQVVKDLHLPSFLLGLPAVQVESLLLRHNDHLARHGILLRTEVTRAQRRRFLLAMPAASTSTQLPLSPPFDP